MSDELDLIKHSVIFIGVFLFVIRFLFTPLGIPISYLIPELVLCGVFLFAGLLIEGFDIHFALLLSTAIVVLIYFIEPLMLTQI